MHVVQPPCIRLFPAHLVCFAATILIIPPHVTKFAMVRACGSGAAGEETGKRGQCAKF